MYQLPGSYDEERAINCLSFSVAQQQHISVKIHRVVTWLIVRGNGILMTAAAVP
jgi:hypothetical protein